MRAHVPLSVGEFAVATIVMLMLSPAGCEMFQYRCPSAPATGAHPDDMDAHDAGKPVCNHADMIWNPSGGAETCTYPDDFIWGSVTRGQLFGIISGPSAIPAGISTASNTLAVDIYRHIAAADDIRGVNILYSSISTYVTLSMLHEVRIQV